MARKLLSWLRPRPRPAAAARPRLECLEGRDVPATPVGGEFIANNSTAGGQNQAAVATDANGDFVMVWVNKTSPAPYTAEDIYARLFNSSGAPLGDAFLVNTYTDYEQTTPSVAMDAAGNFVVVWQSNYPDTGNGYEIEAQRFDAAGNRVGGEFQVNTTATHDQTSPDVAMTPDGRFVVAWQTNVDVVRDGVSGNTYQVHAQRYDAAGLPQGGEFRVDQDYYGGWYIAFAVDPAVSVDSAGGFAVSWTSGWTAYNEFAIIRPDPNRTQRVFARSYNEYGWPESDQRMVYNPLRWDDLTETYVTDTEPWQSESDVAARSDGTGFVVTYYQDISYSLPAWKDPNPFKMDVYARVLGWQSGAISSVFLVPDTQAHGYYGYQGNPAVAVKSDGSFVITWESSWAGAGSFPPQSDPGMGIYARQFTATGTALGLDFHVNTTQDNDQSRPAIAMNGAGHFLIGWEGLDNTNNVDVYGQVYDF